MTAKPLPSPPPPSTFTPGWVLADPLARHWLGQATLRLRREVCWLWRERTAQGLVADSADSADSADVADVADAGQAALDLTRHADDKAAFFAHDATAAHLTALIDAPAHHTAASTASHTTAASGAFTFAVHTLALQPVECFVLALALLPAVDSAAGAVMATVLHDANRNEPTLALAQRLWAQAPHAVLACFDASHPLFTHGLIGPIASAAAPWLSPLRMPPLVARELALGAPVPAPRSAATAPASAPAPAPATATATAPATAPARRLIAITGSPGAPLADAAAADAKENGQTLRLMPQDARAPAQRAQMAVAWLRGEALYLPADTLATSASHGDDDDAADPASGNAAAPAHGHGDLRLPLPALPITLYIGLHARTAVHRLPEPPARTIDVPPATTAQRLEAWRHAVPQLAADVACDAAGDPVSGRPSDLASDPPSDSPRDPTLAQLAQSWRCETPAIGRVGAELARLGRPPSAAELLAATRQALDLGALAQAVTPRFKLAELMLPPAQTRQIDELVTAMRNLGRVHQDWGTGKAWNDGGLAALFAGPPGTGKTMASEAIAHALGLPLYRIDLSQVVNKYIGETEKNLKRLFDAADAADAILFFDEADSLFGKRSEVKDAHDRYANLEVSYLLERMERFKGLAILATNRRKDIDEAFLRRLRFAVDFPLPGVAERQRIWQSMVPAQVDASSLDFDFLAQRFPLAGGHIRAIVFHACLQSADAGAERKLTMQAVIRAVQREYDKLERASSLDQFGKYAPLVAAERVAR